MFKKNDRVEKASGHKWPGVVVFTFETLAGGERYVVECTAPAHMGALRIFTGDQLVLLERPATDDVDGHEWIARPAGLDTWRPLTIEDATPIEIMLYEGDTVQGVFADFWWGFSSIYNIDKTKPAPYAIRQYRVLPRVQQ